VARVPNFALRAARNANNFALLRYPLEGEREDEEEAEEERGPRSANDFALSRHPPEGEKEDEEEGGEERGPRSEDNFAPSWEPLRWRHHARTEEGRGTGLRRLPTASLARESRRRGVAPVKCQGVGENNPASFIKSRGVRPNARIGPGVTGNLESGRCRS